MQVYGVVGVLVLLLVATFLWARALSLGSKTQKDCVLHQPHKRLLTRKPLRIPKIIHQTWKTASLPANFKKWSDTWKKHHPDWTYQFWNDQDLRALIATDFPWFLATYDGYDKHIKRVDAARYFILYKYGGVYADMDFMCLKNLEPTLRGYNIVLGQMGNNRGFNHSVPNALMASVPGHAFWKQVIQTLEERKKAQGGVEWATGPVALYDTLKHYFKPDLCIHAPHIFYPLNWQTRDHVKLNLNAKSEKVVQKLFPGAYAVTFWTGSWKKKKNEG